MIYSTNNNTWQLCVSSTCLHGFLYTTIVVRHIWQWLKSDFRKIGFLRRHSRANICVAWVSSACWCEPVFFLNLLPASPHIFSNMNEMLGVIHVNTVVYEAALPVTVWQFCAVVSVQLNMQLLLSCASGLGAVGRLPRPVHGGWRRRQRGHQPHSETTQEGGSIISGELLTLETTVTYDTLLLNLAIQCIMNGVIVNSEDVVNYM